MKIGLVGAFDRNNYGDLLMPIVMEKQIRKNLPKVNCEFEYYALSDSNMEYVCSKNTKDLVIMYQNPCDIVIVVGGQVLSAIYTGMYLNLQKSKFKIFIIKVMYKLFPNIIERICKKRLKCKSIKPWIFEKKDLNCKKLIYNTVGGNILSSIKDDSIIYNFLNDVDYISIREKDSYEIIKKYSSSAELYPDSIINLSKYITESEINNHISSEIMECVLNFKEYFVFQIKKNYGKNYIDDISNEINKIIEVTGLKCILLPIGYAQGHEDHIILNKIYKKINRDCYIPKFNNIYETIFMIKNSKIFMGTSLHGIITAISYEIPHIVVTTELEKLNSFVNTWKTTPIVNTPIREMKNNICYILDNYDKAKKMVVEANNRLNDLVEENFAKINKIIKEYSENE